MTTGTKRGLIFLLVVLIGGVGVIASVIRSDMSNRVATVSTDSMPTTESAEPTEVPVARMTPSQNGSEIDLGRTEPLSEREFSKKLVELSQANPETPVLRISYVEASSRNEVQIVYRRTTRVVERISSVGTLERWTEVTDEKLVAVSNGTSIKALTGYTIEANQNAMAAYSRQQQRTQAAYQSQTVRNRIPVQDKETTRFNNYYPAQEREFWQRAEAKDPLLRQSRTKYQGAVEEGRSDAEIRHRQRIAEKDQERMQKQLEREKKRDR